MTAKYIHKQYINNEIVVYHCLVEIIKNCNKTYLVELLNFCGDYKPGERIRVHKKNTIL